MPHLEPEDGTAAPKYRFLRRIHASERQFTSVISAYLDERIFKLAPKRFRNEVVIPVLITAGDLFARGHGHLFGWADLSRR